MKITAKLALQQMQRNRCRTLAAAAAIMLSTALTTAVFCFTTSAKTMLVSFLGEGYGAYGESYQYLLLLPAAFFAGLIFVMSVSVISNVFLASANERMHEFGILKCVGGTTRQIIETVIFESLWLSMLGIPAGLVCGLGVGFLTVQLLGAFVAEMNALMQSIAMRPVAFSLSFEAAPAALAAAAIVSFVTVVYAAYKPASRIGKIAALDCMRENYSIEDFGGQNWKFSDKEWIKRCFGFEGILAERNLLRNRVIFKPMLRALTLGILLLLSAGSMVMQVAQIEAYMNPGSSDILLAYESNRRYQKNPVTGREEQVIARPFDSEKAEQIRQRLLAFGDVEVKGIGYDNASYYAELTDKYLTADMRQALEYEGTLHQTLEGNVIPKSTELTVDLLVMDESSYKSLCEQAGASVGSNILLNYYRYNKNGSLTSVVPFTKELTELTLQRADGTRMTLSVDAALMEEKVPAHMIAINEQPIRLVVPKAEVRFYDWYGKAEDELSYMQYAKAVGAEFFPTYTKDPYVQEGFLVRVSREDTMVKVLNIAIVIAGLVIYGFIGVLLLIGLVSLISTLSANIRMRTREFAVLKSVGMTTESLQKMLLCEGLLCALRALLYGVPLGIFLPYMMNLAVRKQLPVRYEIPWCILLGSIGIIFLVVLAVTLWEVQRLKGQRLIESIRG